jgi:cytidine deaminase
MSLDKAIEIAKNVRKNCYAPYSKYCVGCALVCKSGKIYSGCNVENDGIQSICAERVAFTKAISEGERDFEYIVVCGGDSLDSLDDCLPCGYCRQFMSEFVDKDFKIYALSSNDKVTEYSIFDLLPNNFRLTHLS